MFYQQNQATIFSTQWYVLFSDILKSKFPHEIIFIPETMKLPSLK